MRLKHLVLLVGLISMIGMITVACSSEEEATESTAAVAVATAKDSGGGQRCPAAPEPPRGTRAAENWETVVQADTPEP